MTGHFLGFLLAFYFLAGRWSINRLADAADPGSIIGEPRVWIVTLLIPVALLLRPRATRAGLQGQVTSVDIAICGFLVYMMLAAFWASNTESAVDKAYELALMLAVALVIAISRPALLDDEIQNGFWWTIVSAAVVMAGLALFYSTGGRIHAPGGGPNTLGRNAGLMALGSIFLAEKGGPGAKVACAATLLVAILLILMCGSRGALLSSSVGALTLLALARASITRKMAIGCGIAVLGAVLMCSTRIGHDAQQMFHDRILHQTFENRYLASRDDLWLDAVDWIVERPWFGWGLNGYFSNSLTYPHNIFLEVTTEGGVVGLLLLLHLGYACWSKFRRHHSHLSNPTLAALALTFIAAQSSGDLFDSRGVFLMAALATPSVTLPCSVSQAGRRHQRVLSRNRRPRAVSLISNPSHPTN